MRLWIAAMMCCCFGLALAAGQQPQPSVPQSGAQARHAGPVVQPSDGNKRGTDEAPLVVKNYPQMSASDAADAKEERVEKASTDSWMVVIGISSIVVGILAFIILTVQSWGF